MTYSFRTNGNFIDFVHTDDTSLQVESVLRSLHNTSRCVTWSLPEDTTRISFVVDDIRVDNFILTEIDFDGVAIDSQDDFETGITAMFPGGGGGGGVQSVSAGTNVTVTGTATDPIINASGGGSSYLVYTALLSQTGTDAPIATVLENTTGQVFAWSHENVGVYAALFPSGTFDLSKVVVMMPQFYAGSGSLLRLATAGFELDWDTDIDAFVIRSFNAGSTADDVLGIPTGGSPIEIRVYP